MKKTFFLCFVIISVIISSGCGSAGFGNNSKFIVRYIGTVESKTDNSTKIKCTEITRVDISDIDLGATLSANERNWLYRVVDARAKSGKGISSSTQGQTVTFKQNYPENIGEPIIVYQEEFSK